ncbi:MAG: hypothetical protein ACRECW_11730 [Phyllobacterium sp.]
MHWNVIAIGLVGILLGLRLRAPALIVATLLTVLACLFAYGFDQIMERQFLFSTLLLVLTLQCAYLTGLLAGVLWRRKKSDRH